MPVSILEVIEHKKVYWLYHQEGKVPKNDKKEHFKNSENRSSNGHINNSVNSEA